jgi:penicillin-binding protein 1A
MGGKAELDEQKNQEVLIDTKNNFVPNGSDNRPSKKRRVVKIIILVVLLLLVITGSTAAILVISYIRTAPLLDPSMLETGETSYLYDINGEEITSLHGDQHRIAIALEEIPEHVRQAFIAIEDERFYDHFGFDITGSIRAAYANLRAGTIVQGASTISQQLVQNAFLTTETSYKRKIQEIWLAIQLDKAYSKDAILEMYLNRIYFGNTAYGVEAAAQTYFGKSVEELNTAEAAMLAGAVRSPNYYNPIDNKAAAEERMLSVLKNMLRLEFISEFQYRQLSEQDLTYAELRSIDYPYPYFVDYVVHNELLRILTAIRSIGSHQAAYEVIYTGGLQVNTTMEPSIQQHVESILGQTDLYPATIYIDITKVREAIAGLPPDQALSREQMAEFVDEEDGIPQPQAAIVIADPVTGQIKALVGGREYRKGVDEVLRFTSLRQPGSAIKPIITYGPAFEEGVLAGAGSTLDDSPYIGPRGDWFPENFDYQFRGMIPVREALIYSYNLPAVRAFEALGTRVGAAYAEKMGITTIVPEELDNLSLTLGGFHLGVSAIDMAQAYSVLANQGLKVDLHTIESIIDRQGNTIYEYKVEPEQILSPQSAFLVNDILQEFVTSYLGRELRIDRQVAAKTGTTNDWRDVYLVAYTPNLVASFWMGYDEPRMGSIEQGWRYSTVFLREVFLGAFETLEIKEFEQPEGIIRLSVCSKSGLRPNSDCNAAGTVISDYFIAELAPNTVCNMHENGFYNRPPYIKTDHRWSDKGGAGRGPNDAEEMPSDEGTFGAFGGSNFFDQQDSATTQVPDVGGLVLPIAEMRISWANLRVGMVSKQYSNEVPENVVIGQSPAAGMTVFKNLEIHLVVSQGPR